MRWRVLVWVLIAMACDDGEAMDAVDVDGGADAAVELPDGAVPDAEPKPLEWADDAQLVFLIESAEAGPAYRFWIGVDVPGGRVVGVGDDCRRVEVPLERDGAVTWSEPLALRARDGSFQTLTAGRLTLMEGGGERFIEGTVEAAIGMQTETWRVRGSAVEAVTLTPQPIGYPGQVLEVVATPFVDGSACNSQRPLVDGEAVTRNRCVHEACTMRIELAEGLPLDAEVSWQNTQAMDLFDRPLADETIDMGRSPGARPTPIPGFEGGRTDPYYIWGGAEIVAADPELLPEAQGESMAVLSPRAASSLGFYFERPDGGDYEMVVHGRLLARVERVPFVEVELETVAVGRNVAYVSDARVEPDLAPLPASVTLAGETWTHAGAPFTARVDVGPSFWGRERVLGLHARNLCVQGPKGALDACATLVLDGFAVVPAEE